MKKESFIMYAEYLDYFAVLSEKDRAALIMAILTYKSTGELLPLEGKADAFFMVIKNSLDRDAKKYDEIVQARVRAGSKGGQQTQAKRANATTWQQTQANQAVPEHVPDNEHVPVPEHKDTPAPAFVVSQSGVSSQNGATLIEKARVICNASGMFPEERYTVLQLKESDRNACLATVQHFSISEIEDALKNYTGISKSSDHEIACPYRSFVGFMRAGVAKFVSSADPWTAYRKKTAPAASRFGDERKEVKFVEQECPVCGNKYKSTGSCPRCKFDQFTDTVEEYRAIWFQRNQRDGEVI